MIEGRQKFGGYGFADETVGPLTDEIGAGVNALADAARSGFSVPIGDLYADHAAIIRADREAYRAEHPTAAATANVIGGLSMLPAKGAAAAQGLWETVKTGAKVGAGLGAATGAAEGEGATGRIESAAWGAATGAVLGSAVPVLVNVGQRVAGAMKRIYGLKGAGAERRANEMLVEALKRDGIDPATLGAANASGKPLTIADLGPNTRQLVGSASRQGGEGRKMLEEFLENRTLGQFGRITDDLATGTGMRGEDFAATTGSVLQQRGAAAKAGYPAAYAKQAPVLSEGAYSILSTPDGRRAVSTATRMMANKRAPAVDESGAYTVEMLDQIQRAMRDSASKASGARAGEMSGNLTELRNQFLTELPADLRGVMADYRSQSELLDALKAGRDFFKGDAEALASSVQQMSPAERGMFRLGAVRELRGRVGSKLDSGDASGMFQNPAMRERLAAIFPDDVTFQRFVDSTATERAMQETRNAILKNSATAQRLVDDAEFNGGALGEFAMDMATSGGGGVGVARAVTNAALKGKDRFLAGVNEQVAGSIARTATNPNLGQVSTQLGGPGVPALPYPVAPFALPAARGATVGLSAGGDQRQATGWTILPPR